MTKFTKISAAALFALFLTACDKPANNPVETKPAATAATQPEADKKVEAKMDTGAEDYKKFQEWQQNQEKLIGEAINNELEKLGEEKAKDETLVQDTVNNAILDQIEKIQQNAKSLEIKDEQIKVLKEKSLEAMALGAKMIKQNSELAKNPTPEAQKAFSELQVQLDKIAADGQTIEAELNKKYGISTPVEATIPTINPDEIPEEDEEEEDENK
ncbi:hypothetical protein [[Haemophilus] ducreyi]|uniref:p27 n=1 Tax=Haemophilus ducreyi TaxID=730 RepID=Q9RQP3_HAEDC|nr:hypothetical protein [[Haemophilus] ducreyi]AAD55561.1 P27 [[Haemophilus] ducreyi]AKO45073.1 lipoprotein Hlp [[Haemophilus] ducreyi]AKO46475.1 lipoprotein Hlp [[Haemophilus] ducreyi]AKO47817.1 lipoprotein Hlp [[Haemophilus] ducreyi]AKO49204.1 lipoprotein Hlp [[Haemophilus] ducreyi]